MAISNKYIISTATVNSYLSFDLEYGALTLAGSAVSFVGSRKADSVYVMEGLSVDFTQAGFGADRIYLTGAWDDYTKTATSEVITLTRTSNPNEVIKVSAVDATDLIIFKDGNIRSSDAQAAIQSANPAPVLDPGLVSSAPEIPNAGDVQVKAVASGNSITAASFGHGVKLVVVGGRGVDSIYVKDGSEVDATQLSFGKDIIYMRGAWADYTKVTTGETITFTRNVQSGTDTVVEKVVVSASVGVGNDQLVFFDGAVDSNEAKLALDNQTGDILSAITSYNGTLTTPGVDSIAPTVTALLPDHNGVTTSSADLVMTFSEAVKAVSGKTIVIRDAVTNAIVESIDAGSPLVSIQTTATGSVVTINPSLDLPQGVNYVVDVPAGAFKDMAGNPYVGTDGGAGWLISVGGVSLHVADIAQDQWVNAAEFGGAISLQITATSNTSAILADLRAENFTLTLTPTGGGSDIVVSGASGVYDPVTGIWNASLPVGTLVDGKQYTVSATFVGSTGLAQGVSQTTAGNTVSVDTIDLAPTAALSIDSGFSSTDGLTNDATVFTVSGLEVATAAAGVSGFGHLEWQIDGGTLTALASGATDFTMANPADGTHTVNVYQVDIAGNTSVAATKNFMVDTQVSTANIALSIDSGLSSSDALTNDAKVFTVSGLEVADTSSGISGFDHLEWQIDGGTHTTLASGATDFTMANPVDGTHTVNVYQVDIAGNTSVAAAKNFSVDTQVGTANIALSIDSGLSSSDALTNDAKVITVSGLEVADTSSGISGFDHLEWQIDGGTLTALASGATDFTMVNPVDGTHTVNVYQVDIAGNTSVAAAKSFSVDTTVAAPATVALSIDSGQSSTDALTNDAKVFTVSGLEVADATAGVSGFDHLEWQIDGGTHTPLASGETAFTMVNPVDGTHTVNVYQVDIAGNTSVAAVQQFTVDTQIAAPVLSNNNSVTTPTADLSMIFSEAIEAVAGHEIVIRDFATNAIVESIDAASAQITIAGSVVTINPTLDLTPGGKYVIEVPAGAFKDLAGNPTAQIAGTSGWVISIAALDLRIADISPDLWVNATENGAALPLKITAISNAPAILADVKAENFTVTLTPTTGGSSIVVNGTSGTYDAVTGIWSGSVPAGSLVDGKQYTVSVNFVGNTGLAQELDFSVNGNSFFVDTTELAPTVALSIDSGFSHSDALTNDAKVFTVSGLEVAAPASGVSGFHHLEWKLDSDPRQPVAAGATAFTMANPTDGTHTINVYQVDLAGNTSLAAVKNFSVDTQVATVGGVTLSVDSGRFSTDVLTNDATVFTVSGLEVADASLGVSGFHHLEWAVDGNPPETGAAGSTSITMANPADGAHTINVYQVDIAGNTSLAIAHNFGVDTVVAAPATVALGNDSGRSATDTLTKDATVFTVGGLEVATAANAVSGFDHLEWQIDGGTHTTLAAGATDFTMTNPVDGTHTVNVYQVDIAGNTSVAAAKDFTVDTQVAAPATIALTVDSGFSTTDALTNDAKGFTISGLEVADTSLGISGFDHLEWAVDGKARETGAAGATAFTIDNPAEGTHSINVYQVDIAGNTSLAGVKNFSVDTQVAAPSTVALSVDSGRFSTDVLTNDATVFTVSGLEVADATLGVSGFHHLEWAVDGNPPETGAAGSTSITMANPADGAHTINVYQVDIAGNTSLAIAHNFGVDTVVAAPATVALGIDSGRFNTDVLTNDATVFTVGGLEVATAANAVSGFDHLEWQIDGGTHTTLAAGATDFTMTNPVDGTHTVNVYQVDIAGNTSVAAAKDFTVDTQVAAPATIALTIDSGFSITDALTNDAKGFTISGLEVADTSLGISGFDHLEWAVDGEERETGAAGATAFTIGNPVEGTHSINVYQVDIAGNTSLAGVKNFSVDTQVAAPSTVALSVDSGRFSTDVLTNDATVFTVSGLEVADATLGVSGFHHLEWAVDGNPPETGAAGSTSITMANPADGAHTINVYQVDIAGNTSLAIAHNFGVDTVVAAPATVALGNDSGRSATDTLTKDATVFTVSGLEVATAANAVSGFDHLEWQIDGSTHTTLAAGATDFTMVNPVDGTHTVNVYQVDIAGNTSVAAAKHFTVDTQVAAPATIALTVDSGFSTTDALTNDAKSFTISGLEVADTSLGISGFDHLEWQIDGGTHTALASGATAFTMDNPAEGTHVLNVYQVDIAGNTSVAGTKNFSVDTQVAVPGSIALSVDSGYSNTDALTMDAKVFTVGGLEVANATSGISGFHHIEWQLDGGERYTVAAGGTAFTMTNPDDGSHTVNVYQVDIAGNTSVAGSKSFVVDTVIAAPTASLVTDTGSNGTDGITNLGAISISGLEIANLTAGISGYDHLEYQMDMDNWSYGTHGQTDFTLNNNEVGSHSINVRQVDNAGNTSSVSTMSFVLDPTATAPTIAMASDSGWNAFDKISNQYRVFKVTGIEAATLAEGMSGVEHWEYNLDGNAWSSAAPGATDFTIAATFNGTHSVQVRQIDIAGNTSPSTTLGFTVDTKVLIPTLSLRTDSGVDSADGLTNTKVLVVSGLEGVTASAGLSGFHHLEYLVDGAATWSAASVGATAITLQGVSDGIHTVSVRQVDWAGNTSFNATKSFTLDSVVAAPTAILATDSGSIDNDGMTRSGNLFSVIGLEDPNTPAGISGFEHLEYQLDSKQIVTLGTTLTGFSLSGVTDGLHTLRVRQVDMAGNTSAFSTNTFVVDTAVSAPSVTLSTDSGANTLDKITRYGTEFTVANLEVADAGAGISGFDYIEWKLDEGDWWSVAAHATNFTLPTVTDGSHVISVRQIDFAGNTSSAGTLSFGVDRTVGGIGATMAADTGKLANDAVTNNASVFTVSDMEVASTLGQSGFHHIEYQVDGNTLVTVGNGLTNFTLPPLADGAHSISVRQVDTAGNTSSNVVNQFVLDTTAATMAAILAVDSGRIATDGITKQASFAVSGLETKVDGSGISGADYWEYMLDSGAWTSSGVGGTSISLTGLTNGVHTLSVHQIDMAGNTSANSSKVFAYDNAIAAPTAVALITDGGSDNTDRITNGSAKAFKVSGVESVNTASGVSGFDYLLYSVDATGAWNTGAQGDKTFTLGSVQDGTHTINVKQVDLAGNTSSAISLNVVLDQAVASPSITLLNDSGVGGDATTNERSFVIGGLEVASATDGVSGFHHVEFQLDATGSWVPLGPGVTAFSLSPTVTGTHTLNVRQVDIAGNVSDVTSKDFSIDTFAAPLGVTLVNDSGSNTGDLITKSGSVFNVTGQEIQSIGNGIAGMDYWRYQLDSGTFTTAVAGATSFTLAGGLIDGAHAVNVQQVDKAGNSSTISTLNFVIDSTALAPTAALATDSGNSSIDNVTNVKLFNVLNLEDVTPGLGHSGFDHYIYQIDGGAVAPGGIGITTLALGALDDGVHTLSVGQVDIAGNTSSMANTIFSYDTKASAPTLALATDSGAGTYATDTITNVGSRFKVSGVETAVASSAVSGFHNLVYRVDGGSATVVADLATDFTLGGSLTEGQHSIVVQQIDMAGNTSVGSTLGFKVDTKVLSPTASLVVDNGGSATDSIISGTSTVFGVTNLEVASPTAGGLAYWQYQLDTGTWTTVSTAGVTNFTLSGMGDGSHFVSVKQIDVAGNTSTATVTNFIVDNAVVAPTVSLLTDVSTSGTVGLTNQAVINVSGLELKAGAISGVDALAYKIDGNAVPNFADLVNGVSTAAVTIAGLADGLHTLAVSQIDVAGNTSAEIVKTFKLDTVVSTLGLTLAVDSGASATDGATNNGKQFNVSGFETASTAASGIARWEYQLDSTAAGSWVAQAATASAISLGSDVDGTHTMYVRQIDLAGNTSALTKLGFVSDHTAATPTGITLTNDSGVTNDGISNNGSLFFSVAGLEAAGTANTASGFHHLEYQIDGTGSWSSAAVGATSITLSAPSQGALHTLGVRQIDFAGNTSGQVSKTYGYDATAVTPTLSLATDNGSSTSDKLFSGDANFSVAGLEVVDAAHGISGFGSIQYNLDGGGWTNASVTGSNFSIGSLSDGTHTLQVHQIDNAGNTSGDSTALSFTYDNVVAAPFLSLASDTGYSATDGYTNNAKLHVDYSGVAGVSSFEYRVGSGSWIATSLDGSGNFTPTLSSTPDGSVSTSVAVRFSSTSGVTSDPSSSVSYHLDTTVPTATITQASYLIDSQSIVVRGTNFLTLGAKDTDISKYLDWSKLTYKGDSSTNVSFSAGDITTAVIQSDGQLRIGIASGKAPSLSSLALDMTDDKFDFNAGFLGDLSGNLVQTAYTDLGRITTLDLPGGGAMPSSKQLSLFVADGFLHGIDNALGNGVSMDGLDGIFKYDVNGNTNGGTAFVTDQYRYSHTSDGFIIALTSLGNGVSLMTSPTGYPTVNEKPNANSGMGAVFYGSVNRSAFGDSEWYWTSTAANSTQHHAVRFDGLSAQYVGYLNDSYSYYDPATRYMAAMYDIR